MNKKVIVVLVAAVVALVVLWVYSFGPLSKKRAGTSVNPSSSQALRKQVSLASSTVTENVYHNRDVRENFYTISVPTFWQLQSASRPGSYRFILPHGEASSELLDIPDNTTPELQVLSQEEPRLKRTLAGYERVDYRRLSVAGNDAYQLTYRYAANGAEYQAVRTYVTGEDCAVVITLDAERNQAGALASSSTAVLNSFHWE